LFPDISYSVRAILITGCPLQLVIAVFFTKPQWVRGRCQTATQFIGTGDSAGLPAQSIAMAAGLGASRKQFSKIPTCASTANRSSTVSRKPDFWPAAGLDWTLWAGGSVGFRHRCVRNVRRRCGDIVGTPVGLSRGVDKRHCAEASPSAVALRHVNGRSIIGALGVAVMAAGHSRCRRPRPSRHGAKLVVLCAGGC
jgi:hypothetical protein